MLTKFDMPALVSALASIDRCTKSMGNVSKSVLNKERTPFSENKQYLYNFPLLFGKL